MDTMIGDMIELIRVDGIVDWIEISSTRCQKSAADHDGKK